MRSPNHEHHRYTPLNSPRAEVELYDIAHEMRKAHLSDEFIASAIKIAFQYEGVRDLVKLWRDEKDAKERDEIIADIHDLIDDCTQNQKEKFTLIKMNDLDAISKDIRAFKDSLLNVVNKKGGINRLSKLTKIPQPSLSRFFNSDAMPRRGTLLKIAAALKIDEVKIDTLWVR